MTEQVRYIFKTRTGLYPFDLHHRAVELGNVKIRQFWMDLGTLYDARPDGSVNAWSTVQYFWDLCRRYGTQGDRSVQESYLLARLLPFNRPAGSNRILCDARQRAVGLVARQDREESVREIDRLLAADRWSTRSMRCFRERTAGALGLPDVSNGVREKYQSFLAELFDGPCAILQADPEAPLNS